MRNQVTRSEIEGVTMNMRSERDSDCICCDGPHIFSYGMDINPYPSIYPGLKVDSIEDWLHEALGPFRDQPGLKVRVILEVEGLPFLGENSNDC